MADQILSSTKLVDSDNVTVLSWEYSYSVESGEDTNQFCVVVAASEMTDSTSETEARTKANTKAAAIKAAWVATLATMPSATVVVSEPVDVTLS